MTRPQKFEMIKNLSRRAVSEIIVTLLLLGITVIGGMLVWTMLSGSQQQINIETQVQDIAGSELDIIMVGYDTRDGADLGGITNLDNFNDGALSAGEFIVLKIRDRLIGNFQIDKVVVNEVEHTWSSTALTLSSAPTLSSTPTQGTFIIINGPNPSSGSINIEPQLVTDGSDVRLVIALSNSLSNINLNKAMRVSVVVTGFDTTNFVITSGDTR